MLEAIKTLIRSQKSCVLATAVDNRPYCSLMGYVAEEDCRHIYLLTRRDSRKYRNLVQNPSCSLLIDSRSRQEDRALAQALTIEGACTMVDDKSRAAAITARFNRTHPHLKGFCEDPDAVLLDVAVDCFLLLDGPHAAHFEAVR